MVPNSGSCYDRHGDQSRAQLFFTIVITAPDHHCTLCTEVMKIKAMTTAAACQALPQAWHQARETPAPSFRLNRCPRGVNGIDGINGHVFSLDDYATVSEIWSRTSATIFRGSCASARLAFLATPRETPSRLLFYRTHYAECAMLLSRPCQKGQEQPIRKPMSP